MKNNLHIFNVTNKADSLLEDLYCEPAGVGPNIFPDHYTDCKVGENIQHKDPYYAEYVFHYWFWKNQLMDYDNDTWLGFCQYRRYWLKENFDENLLITRDNLKDNVLNSIPSVWSNYDAVVAKRVYVNNPKFMKLIKRGYRNILNDPTVIFDKKKHNVKLHFDMSHGYGKLDKAIDLLDRKERDDFREYVNKNTFFNPNHMFISHPKIMNEWFKSVFDWLLKCEDIFIFKDLQGYEKRLYGYFAERYLSYWFNKYTNTIEWPWLFVDMNNGKRTDVS
tara:strand:+ start:412 stop:1242 length:831 start_codon:yes stop_codon:yes gene_type:complete